MYVIYFGGQWDDQLPLVEFAIIPVLEWHPMRHYMVKSVDPLCVEQK